MSQLLENTYLAYNQFLEGELNQYDLMSLIEDEIISGEVLESMLEEGFINKVVSGAKKYAVPLVMSAAIGAGGSVLNHKVNDYINSHSKNKEIQKQINEKRKDILNRKHIIN